MIRKFVDKDPRGWDKMLHYLLFVSRGASRIKWVIPVRVDAWLAGQGSIRSDERSGSLSGL